MRKTVVYCDKCGAEIMGIPIQIIPEHSDVYGDCKEPYLEDAEESERPPWIERMLDKEFCEDCAKEIFDYALNPVSTDEKELDREENESSSSDLDYSEALDRIRNEKKMKMRVFRDGIRVNGSNIWSKELFPYIGGMVKVEITHKLITVKDGEKVLFIRDLSD